MSKFEKFKAATLNRKDILKAPYNPRRIQGGARKRLQANLETVGLLGPVVVNSTTNHLVSGHQRLAILDALEGREDYSLDVALVSLTLEQEKAQNVFFNNHTAQGQFDTAALAALVRGDQLDAAAMGFHSTAALDALLPPVDMPDLAPPAPTNAPLYQTVVFKDREDREAFLQALGLDADERYVAAGRLRTLLRRE